MMDKAAQRFLRDAWISALAALLASAVWLRPNWVIEFFGDGATANVAIAERYAPAAVSCLLLFAIANFVTWRLDLDAERNNPR